MKQKGRNPPWTATSLISASDKNFNPQNTSCIPAVKILIFLDLDEKS